MPDRKGSGQIATDTRAARRGFEVWGLTGGIASGKSTAAKFFEETGIAIIDADKISRELSAPGGAAHKAILQRFGTADRMRLRNLVFADEAARRDLEAILHPLIQSESMRQMNEIARARAGRSTFVYEAALLVETGRYRELDGLIVVEAPREDRVARLCARDGVAKDLAERMIDSQISDVKRREVATELVANAGTLEELRARVREVAKRLRGEGLSQT